MKKIKNIFAPLVAALVGLSLTACSGDDLATNQYQDGVSLNAYGPNPVMRGGQLRFVGSNLDQIASVAIPGVPEITNIEVLKAGVPSEIRITVPKDGPLVGYVTLKTKADQALSTKTQLEYIEGIEITKIPEETVMPGQTIKIEGDYLNLIYSMAFADGVLVSASDFVSQDRYFIEVKVPEKAKTGKLEFYTADLTIQRTAKEEDELQYQTIVSDDALIVGLPSTSKIASPRGTVDVEGEILVKAGEMITLTGDYYHVVSGIKFGDVKTSDMMMSEDGTTLKFTLPAEAPDGVFCLVCKSGEEVPVATLVTVKPTNCAAAPNPVKANGVLTITGNDMDLVTAVQFDGADDVTGDNLNVAADKVVVALVPETAKEGSLRLVMANGETVDVAFKLVKPVATGYNANPVSAGAELQVKGTNLDLVKSVTFGEATATVEDGAVSADGTTLNVKVPMEAKSGKPILNLANGDKIEAPELNISEAVFCYITNMPVFDDDNTPAAGDVLTVPVKNGDKLEKVLVNGNEVRYVYSNKNSTLTFGIPEDATSKSVLVLVSSNGEISYEIPVIPAGKITNVIFNGPFELTWSTSTQGLIPASLFDNLPDGNVSIVFDYTVTGADAKMKVNNGSWGHIVFETGLAPASETLYVFDPNATQVAFELSAEAIANLKASATDWGGILIIHGQNAIINRISLVIEIPQETTLWEGHEDMGEWNNQPYILADGGADLKDIGAKAGQTVRCYGIRKTADWQLQVLEGHWSDNANPYGNWGNWSDDEFDANGCLQFTLTDTMLERAYTSQGWGGVFVVQGKNFILTKMTIE